MSMKTNFKGRMSDVKKHRNRPDILVERRLNNICSKRQTSCDIEKYRKTETSSPESK